MTTTPKEEPQHSAIGPSALGRLLACPASHKASKGVVRASSSYASEGSVAHEIVELDLKDEGDVLDERPALGDKITYEGNVIHVDQDMLDGVDQMVSFCQPLKKAAATYWVEKRVHLKELWDGNPPEPIYGTVDFGAYIEDAKTLYVVDFKYGRLPVSPVDNPQAYAYALGAVYELGFFPEHIIIVIIQPRGQDGEPVKVDQISGLDLLIWAKEVLKPGVDALFKQAAPYATGDHCRFCAVKSSCPALRELAKRTSRVEFGELPPDPITMSEAELGKVMDHVQVLNMWFEAIRAETSGRIEKGKVVPNWKLVPKRGMRKWTDVKETFNILADVDEAWERKLKTPTQVEKANKEVYDQLFADGHINSQSSGSTLAPQIDPRVAVKAKSAKDEFGLIEP